MGLDSKTTGAPSVLLVVHQHVDLVALEGRFLARQLRCRGSAAGRLRLEILQVVEDVLLHRIQIGQHLWQSGIFFLQRIEAMSQAGHSQSRSAWARASLVAFSLSRTCRSTSLSFSVSSLPVCSSFSRFFVGKRLVLFLGIVAALLLRHHHQPGDGPLQGKAVLPRLPFPEPGTELVVACLVLFQDLGPAGFVLLALQGLGDIDLEGLDQLLHVRRQLAPLAGRQGKRDSRVTDP